MTFCGEKKVRIAFFDSFGDQTSQIYPRPKIVRSEESRHSSYPRHEDPAYAEREAAEFEKQGPGKFAKTVRHYVGALIFVTQCTRPDISFAVQYLSTKQDKWLMMYDSDLIHLFGYLKKTTEFILWGRVFFADIGKLTCRLQTDGSHAGCKATRRGVSGFCVRLLGENGTDVLMSWGTKRQGPIFLSSGECEIFAIVYGTREYIKIVMQLNYLLGYKGQDAGTGVREKLEVDAKVALSIVKRSGSTAVRHLRRTAGISVSWIHRYWCAAEREFVHRYGTQLEADAFTKALATAEVDKYNSMHGLVAEPVEEQA